MSSKEFNIIIITHNSQRHISGCINSIINSKTDLRFKIIIIDNNSSDKTVNIIKKKFRHDILFIKNNINIGFSKAVNIGIKLSKNKDILLINPDTRCEQNSIQELLECKNKYSADICGGKMVKNKRENHKTIVREPTFMTGLFDFTNLKKIFPHNKWHSNFYYSDMDKKYPQKVDVVSGGYMFISKKVIKSIGLFDENFFMYLEDIDYCIRAKRKSFNTYYFPSSKIWHEGGGSSNNQDKINYQAWIKSRSYYFKKNYKLIPNLILQTSFLIDRLFVYIIRFFKSKIK